MVRPLNWGEWIISRAHVVGLENKRKIAKAVGCGHPQVSRWSRMRKPPRFRRGFEHALAHALKTDRSTLLEKWERLRPEDPPMMMSLAHEVPWAFPTVEQMRRKKIADLAAQMDRQQLDRMEMTAWAIALGKPEELATFHENQAAEYRRMVRARRS